MTSKSKEARIITELKKRELNELIFRAIGATLLIGGTFFMPTLPVAYKTILKLIYTFKKDAIQDKKIRRSLSALEKREIISFQEKDGELYVHIREEHHQKVIKYSLKMLLDFRKTRKVWNGKWFIVFFDVPEIQRNKRNKLRKLLRFIGFYPYQKSVYLFPFECKDEINLVRRMVESGSYLKYIIADEIEDESRLRTYFNI